MELTNEEIKVITEVSNSRFAGYSYPYVAKFVSQSEYLVDIIYVDKGARLVFGHTVFTQQLHRNLQNDGKSFMDIADLIKRMLGWHNDR